MQHTDYAIGSSAIIRRLAALKNNDAHCMRTRTRRCGARVPTDLSCFVGEYLTTA